MKHNKPVSASSAATCSAHCDRRWNGPHREMEHTICPSMNCETMPGCDTEYAQKPLLTQTTDKIFMDNM